MTQNAAKAAPALGYTPRSLRSERLVLVYVPNVNVSEPATAGRCGEFHLGWNGRSVGALSLIGKAGDHAVIGYGIAPEFRRHGLASEALATVMAAASSFGLALLSAHCRSDNAASRGVLEKNGFVLTSASPWQAQSGDTTRQFMVYQWNAATCI